MNFEDLTTTSQLEDFLMGVQAVAFGVIGSKDERYKWVQDFLVRFRYYALLKSQKGVVIQCIVKMSGYSRQQVTRLIDWTQVGIRYAGLDSPYGAGGSSQ